MFITFEGVEGAGKTTQVSRLARGLERLGCEVVLTEEPGGTELGERVRELVKHARNVPLSSRSELFLFLASRAQLVESVIVPALARGATVVCDRFADSTLAYQCYGRGLDLGSVRRANELAVEGLAPDLTFLLDLPHLAGLQRKLGANDSGWDRFEQEIPDFHYRVRRGFLELASQQPDRWCVIDASQPVEQIEGLVLARVRSALQLPRGERRDKTGGE